jgi:hypothetical protein
MFRKLFGGSAPSQEKINDAVKYFFEFSLHLLNQGGDGPFKLSEGDRFRFRNEYVAKSGIENYGVIFFAKIELESTSFTNLHLSSRTTYKIGFCTEPTINMNDPLVREVKNHLSNTI